MSIAQRFLLILCCIVPVAAQSAGDPGCGEILADTCMGCHGIKGYRNAYPSYRVPKLGGQHAEYLVLGLKGYKNLGRAHSTMQAQSADLSEQEMADLAAYFAAQGDLAESAVKSSAQIERGRAKSAVCAACHGETGLSETPNWPSLAGQHEDYLVETMMQYRRGDRDDPVMAGQLVNLTEDDIEDLAAFYAAQPGLFTVEY